jgi:hypothetical protein
MEVTTAEKRMLDVEGWIFNGTMIEPVLAFII